VNQLSVVSRDRMSRRRRLRASRTGSESSGATRRVAPSPSSWSTARRTGRSGRCSWWCCGRASA